MDFQLRCTGFFSRHCRYPTVPLLTVYLCGNDDAAMQRLNLPIAFADFSNQPVAGLYAASILS